MQKEEENYKIFDATHTEKKLTSANSPIYSSYGSSSLHFHVHLEMANNHRNKVILCLSETLIAGGHIVTISCEGKIAFQFGQTGEVNVIDNKDRIRKAFGGKSNIAFHLMDTYCGDNLDCLEKANSVRQEKLVHILQQTTPDWVILWSGNFQYQKGSKSALADCNLLTKTLFTEVAWFSQSDYIYLNNGGVNAFSSICGKHYPALQPHQKIKFDLWKDRFLIRRFGNKPPVVVKNRVFVPLQIDTDTSIALSSPFKTMGKFISFLEEWIPDHIEVIIKLHPKASYDYVVSSHRRNFKIVAGGNIDVMLSSADVVLGINSTVLIEAIALGKKVVTFGEGLFSNTGATIEAQTHDLAETIFNKKTNQLLSDSFLYSLVFEHQISLTELQRQNFPHLATRLPFKEMSNFTNSDNRLQEFTINAEEGKSMINVGKSKVAKSACLDVERGGQILIGDDCEIRHHAVLEVSGRYNGTIEIGNHSVIGIGNWLQGSGLIKIGNDVILGPYVAIVSTNHQYEDVAIPVAQQPLTTGEVIIEDDVWVGAHVTIAQNVRIGKHSIIGANSFVNKDVPPYSIVAGAPAKVIKTRK